MDKTDREKTVARANAARANRSHRKQPGQPTPAEEFDWDRALEHMKAILDRIEQRGTPQ